MIQISVKNMAKVLFICSRKVYWNSEEREMCETRTERLTGTNSWRTDSL